MDDTVSLDQFQRIADTLFNTAKLDFQILFPAFIEIAIHPADPREGTGESRSGETADQIVSRLFLVVEVPVVGKTSHINQSGGKTDQMVEHPVKLGEHYPHELGPFGDFNAKPRLDCLGIGDIVDHRGAVIQPVGKRHDLIVGSVFRGFLETPVQVADLVDVGQDGFAVQGGEDADGTMGGGMRRADVEVHDIGVNILHRGVIHPVFQQPGLDLFFQAVGLVADLTLFDRIILAQRVSLELPVIEDPPQIGMPLKSDAVLVVYLSFSPVGRAPQMGGGGDTRIGVGHRRTHLDKKIIEPIAESINYVESGLLLLRVVEIVNRRDIHHQTAIESRIIFQPGKRFLKIFRLNINNHRIQHNFAGRVRKSGLDFF
ncbi:MAG: hypothetical protein ACD_75C01187G0003 [uncultured bacterium]|nr:MAG: hypothetical protein ACD_75C01187G0003 [uncultured bacterium]